MIPKITCTSDAHKALADKIVNEYPEIDQYARRQARVQALGEIQLHNHQHLGCTEEEIRQTEFKDEYNTNRRYLYFQFACEELGIDWDTLAEIDEPETANSILRQVTNQELIDNPNYRPQ